MWRNGRTVLVCHIHLVISKVIGREMTVWVVMNFSDDQKCMGKRGWFPTYPEKFLVFVNAEVYIRPRAVRNVVGSTRNPIPRAK